MTTRKRPRDRRILIPKYGRGRKGASAPAYTRDATCPKCGKEVLEDRSIAVRFGKKICRKCHIIFLPQPKGYLQR